MTDAFEQEEHYEQVTNYRGWSGSDTHPVGGVEDRIEKLLKSGQLELVPGTKRAPSLGEVYAIFRDAQSGIYLGYRGSMGSSCRHEILEANVPARVMDKSTFSRNVKKIRAAFGKNLIMHTH